MGWNDIIWTGIAGIVGFLSLTASVMAHRSQLAVVSSAERRVPTGEAPPREPRQAETPEDRAIRDERHRLMEAKTAAEKAYAQRVTVAEREFTARRHRAEVHLRAAEMFLEHAQESGRTSGVETRRRLILDARAQLADAMLEHRLVLAAAEKLLADTRAQASDVLAATSALEAFDADSERSRS